MIAFADKLNIYKRVIIYGASRTAEDLICLLKDYDCFDKISVAVTKPQDNQATIEGLRVHAIDDFEGYKDVIVIIAGAPNLYAEMRNYAYCIGLMDCFTVEEIIDEIYENVWKSPIKSNKILLQNFLGDSYGRNPKYIAEYLLKIDPDLDLVWAVRNSEKAKSVPSYIRTVRYGSFDYYRELGTAHVWVDNNDKSIFSRKRKGQIYVQTWHGIGPFKKIMFDAPDKFSKSSLYVTEYNSSIEDIMISASAFNTLQYRRAFHFNNEVYESGYPRNDIIIYPGNIKDRVCNRLKINSQLKMALYAPTFRNNDFNISINIDSTISALEKRFGGRFAFVVHQHPNDKSIYKNGKYIDARSYDDIQELLAASDVLITDYSSIMWDFSISGKPVFLFHPDKYQYEANDRDFYISFDDMPYIESENNEDLAKKILEFDEKEYKNNLESFLSRWGSFDKGNAADKVARKIVSMIENYD